MVPTEGTVCLPLGRVCGKDNGKHGMMRLCMLDYAMLQQQQQSVAHDQAKHSQLLLKARH